MAGQLEEHVLERRRLGSEVGHRNRVIGETLDHMGDEIVAAPANRDTSLSRRSTDGHAGQLPEQRVGRLLGRS